MTIPNNRYTYKRQILQPTVGRFDPIENRWTRLGYLKVPRSGHGVIRVDNEFIVVGGWKVPDANIQLYAGYSSYNYDMDYNDVLTESCKLSGQAIICTTRKPQLSVFADYPELMLMP